MFVEVMKTDQGEVIKSDMGKHQTRKELLELDRKRAELNDKIKLDSEDVVVLCLSHTVGKFTNDQSKAIRSEPPTAQSKKRRFVFF